jgi:serine/threonine protein phosphatase PrpC
MKQIAFNAYGLTDVGTRKKNDDAFLIDEDLGLFLVADGIGGHEKGEVASWFTVENLQKIIASTGSARDGHMTLEPIDDGDWTDDALLGYAVLVINKQLYDLGQKRAKASPMAAIRTMGTTLVSLLARGDRAYVTNIGDSRAYRIAQGQIKQLTQDHSWIEERVRSGELSRELADQFAPRNITIEMRRKHRDGELSPEEEMLFKKKTTIMRSVGTKEEVEADITVLDIRAQERYLLCSDGLSNFVDEKDLLEFGQMNDLKKACEELVDLALVNGSKDNITVLLVDVRTAADKPSADEGHFTME